MHNIKIIQQLLTLLHRNFSQCQPTSRHLKSLYLYCRCGHGPWYTMSGCRDSIGTISWDHFSIVTWGGMLTTSNGVEAWAACTHDLWPMTMVQIPKQSIFCYRWEDFFTLNKARQNSKETLTISLIHQLIVYFWYCSLCSRASKLTNVKNLGQLTLYDVVKRVGMAGKTKL